jgi:hypothetical protein
MVAHPLIGFRPTGRSLQDKSTLPPGPHFTTISEVPSHSKGIFDDLSRLPCAGLPTVAPTHPDRFCRCPGRQPAVAVRTVWNALSRPARSVFRPLFRALRHLRQSRAQTHRPRACHRLCGPLQAPPRYACLPLHPVPPQVLLHTSPQGSQGRPTPHRQLSAVVSPRRRDKFRPATL